jgi:hypothetical protein
MSQIGRLLQGGILGGAQAYEDAARLHLAQEQARRDAQFDPVRMQNLQAELEDRRSRAERMRRGEAATKQVFEFMKSQRAAASQPGMGGAPAARMNPLDVLPLDVLNDADRNVFGAAMGDYSQSEASMKDYNTVMGAIQQNVYPFLDPDLVQKGVENGWMTVAQAKENKQWWAKRGAPDDEKRRGALIDALSIRPLPTGGYADDSLSRIRFAGMTTDQLEREAQLQGLNEKAAAAQAEQQKLTAQAQQLGIDPSLAGIMTGAQLGEIAQRRAMPAASGSNTARNNGIAESIEARARALESQLIKSPSPELESQVQMLRAAETAARAGDVLPDGGVVLFGGQDVGGGFARVMQPNGQIISVDARLVQQSMGASGAGAATAQPSPDLDAAAISAFTQRFGVPPDPSNPQHVDAFAEIEAQLQSPR